MAVELYILAAFGHLLAEFNPIWGQHCHIWSIVSSQYRQFEYISTPWYTYRVFTMRWSVLNFQRFICTKFGPYLKYFMHPAESGQIGQSTSATLTNVNQISQIPPGKI
jgi:hypothetical protein